MGGRGFAGGELMCGRELAVKKLGGDGRHIG